MMIHYIIKNKKMDIKLVYLLESSLKEIYSWFPDNSEIFFAENFTDYKSILSKNSVDYVFIGNLDNEQIEYLIKNYKYPLYLIDTEDAAKVSENILSYPFILTYDKPADRIKFQLLIINCQKYHSLLNDKKDHDLNNYSEILDKKLVKDDALLKNQENMELVTRLVGLGEITAFIIHELKQPLTAILNYIDLSIRKIDQTDKIIGYLRKSNIQVIRMSEMINNLHRYIQKSVITLVNINQIIVEVMDLLRQRFIVHNIKIEFDLAENLPPIMGDYNQLMQVFLNLINNAFDALSACDKNHKLLFIRTYYSEADQSIIVELTDNGMGIPEDMQERIFDMFVTTKKDGKGTGLGLYITKKITRVHGGEINLFSKPGENTTFLLSFPVNNVVRTLI